MVKTKKWTMRKLAAELCHREGKKHQVNIADMMEIIGCLTDVIAEGSISEFSGMVDLFLETGKKRAKRR